MESQEAWYILKQPAGQCTIVTASSLASNPPDPNIDPQTQQWGPFSSQGEAIARRIGLIRSGHCQPQ